MDEIEFMEYVKNIPKLAQSCDNAKFKLKFEEMAVHTRMRKPTELLLKRRPNETQEVLDYRECNYEAITYGSINKAFDNIDRIFNNLNYALIFADEEIQDYLKTRNFLRSDFKTFFRQIVTKRMIEDPNGFLIWLPSGVGMSDKGEAVTPIPKLMFSFSLIDWEDDYIVFLSDENTIIKQPGKTKNAVAKSGKVFYIFTKTEFYRYKEKSGGEYELILEYTHDLDELPVIPLGGDYNADGIYESFFAPFVPFANETIRQFSDAQSLSVLAAHPIREEFYTECEVKELDVKRVKGKDGKWKDKEFPVSYAEQRKVIPFKRSPYQTVIREVPENDDSGMGKVLPADVPSIRFIHPDINFVKNAWETTFMMLEKSEDALHMNLGQMNQSGVAKELDLLSHDDMINKIGNQILSLQHISARFIVAYIKHIPYADAEVKLTKPASFRPKSEAELLEELGKLKTANAPAMMVAAVARELAKLRFSGDEINQKIFEIIATYDPLFIYSLGEKQSMVISNVANKDDVTKSAYYYTFLLNISKELGDATFLERSIEDLNTLFNEKIQPYLIPAVTKLVDENGNPQN